MFPVSINDKTVRSLYTVAFQYAVKIRERTVFRRTCDHKQLAASFQIVLQKRRFFVRNIALWRIDQQRVRVLRNFIGIEQREAF